ncbi:MAG: efflux RND transporter periplasmic adaptor subunit [Bacteroidetes bacterium]|nr:efflux RND transporter periplasmic adaptor subunit [Bacteroidota bacterium]MCY4225602.1 efflux RND transporter periplasmic adaptor subunit [Bacteroidota bacterium]
MKHTYLVFLCCILWLSCASPEGSVDTETPAPDVTAKRVEVLDLSPSTFHDVIELTGIVEARNDVIVSSRSTGRLEYIAELGRRVRAGDVVASTEDDLLTTNLSQAEAQVDNAQAAFKIAEESYTRQSPLFADSIISELEFIRLEATYEQAKSALAQTEALFQQVSLQVQYTSMTAPIYGVVEDHYVEAGEQVIPGTEILRLVDARNVYISAGISERYAGDIEVGTPAEIRLPASSISSRLGQVIFSGSVINPESRSFEVNIEVQNEDGRLKPEMIVELGIVRMTLDSALVIPGNAIIRTEDGLSVFVITDVDGRQIAQMRDITPGPEYANQSVILDGLHDGDHVVIRGQSTLGNQDLVIIDETFNELDEYGVPVMNSSSVMSTDTDL